MSQISKIEWTEATWNPVTGCTKISAGCENCYAETMAYRLRAMGNPSYFNGFDVTLHDRLLTIPLRWKRPRMIFVNSMSDLFHEAVPFEFIKEVFSVMEEAERHVFQVLTKRSERLRELSPRIDWPNNVWVGVSVEDEHYTYRIDDLRRTGSKLKFVSFEPLLAPITEVDLNGIEWVIVGGESGARARPVEEDWILEILRHCRRSDVPFFFKQWGGVNKRKTGRVLLGRTWDEMPAKQARFPLNKL